LFIALLADHYLIAPSGASMPLFEFQQIS
jgi:hypothetical protein